MTGSSSKFKAALGRMAGALVAASFAAAPAALTLSSAAHAQASAKAIVDAAKARGEVGEQADGYLGLVRASASEEVRGAVAEINQGRAAAYRQAAAATGVSPVAAGEAAAHQLFARIPPGQFYRNGSGAWARK